MEQVKNILEVTGPIQLFGKKVRVSDGLIARADDSASRRLLCTRVIRFSAMAARRRRRAGLTCCYDTTTGMRERDARRTDLGCSTRQFVAVVSALGGIQLLATMDGTVAIFALPKIQNDLGLSDATRSWVITALRAGLWWPAAAGRPHR